MLKNLDQIKSRAADIVASLSCDYAEIRISSSRSTSITLSGGETDSFSSGSSLGGSARVLANGAWGFVSFNDIGDLESFSKKALEIALKIDPAEKTAVARSGAVKGSFFTETARDVDSVTPDEKFELLKKYNEILRAPSAVKTTRAVYSDVRSGYLYVNSEGSDLSYDRSYCGVSLASIARDGALIQPFHESVSGYGGFELVENMEEAAERVARTAVDLLGAESVPGGRYRVVADQKLAGVFIHEAFGHLSEADFVHENERMKKIMTIGNVFGPEGLNVVDCGSMPGLSGYIPFDDEGVVPGKTRLISNGVLSGRLHSRETALKMDEPLTGNARAINVMRQPIVRMTNTYIENGKSKTQDLFDSAENGIYAIDMNGGQTNLEMFTFTAACGYEIKNGRPGKMYRDIVLSGNVFTTLKNILMIADDGKMFGGLGGCGKGGQAPLPVSLGGPHILIDDVLIGGSQ
ncbi:MAG: TldD/PmbA family protein [Spirochaetes bacterium]|jgi:TldD protein|nr:TldD/PmbA family protein [Spirochaetota bacterium]